MYHGYSEKVKWWDSTEHNEKPRLWWFLNGERSKEKWLTTGTTGMCGWRTRQVKQFVFHMMSAYLSFPTTCSSSFLSFSLSLSPLTSSSRKIGQALHKRWRSGGVTAMKNWREGGGWGRVEINGNAKRRMGKCALSPPHSPSPVLSGMRPAESRLCLTCLRVRLSHNTPLNTKPTDCIGLRL